MSAILLTQEDRKRLLDLAVEDANSQWDTFGLRVLHVASRAMDTTLVKSLLFASANPNEPDNQGRTPFLDFCASSGCLPASSLLSTLRLWIEHGANPGAREDSGFTPLHSLLVHHPGTVEAWVPVVSSTPEHLQGWFSEPQQTPGQLAEPPWKSIPYNIRTQFGDHEAGCRSWLENVLLKAPAALPLRVSLSRRI